MTKRAIFRISLIAIVLAAAFFLYRFFFIKKQPAERVGVEAVSAALTGARVDDEFLSFLNRLQKIDRLDGTLVFNHPVWVSLEDKRRDLGDEPIGRRNPFAPLSADLAAGTTSSPLPRGR